MSKRNFFLEIGTEELPAGFIPRALKQLKGLLDKGLTSARLGFEEISTLGTPRRLTLVVKGLDSVQSDVELEVRGPKKEAAFDVDGNPTKALVGFAKGQGVEAGDVEIVKTDKGEHVLIRKQVKGEKVASILPEILTKVLATDIFPKSMRWGAGEVTFARPVHWLLAFFGDEPLSFSFGHVKSGRLTFGHRFMGTKGPIEVTGFDNYLEALRGAYVTIDPDERKEKIRKDLAVAAVDAGGELLTDDAAGG